MGVHVKDSPVGIVIKPITPLEDLAGVDAGKVSLARMRKELDNMRSRYRY